MKTYTKYTRLFITLLMITLLVCSQATAMTIGEEREIGQKLLYRIKAEFSLLDDPDISQYINRLGSDVLAQAGPKYFDYHFFVVPYDEFNAFAAPSGLIFFFSGLIETMKTEDELLSVLAHEIGHVVSRHISTRSSKSGKVSTISMALAVASLALGDPSLAAGLFSGFQAAGQAANLHFSRLDEEESDRLSYDWMIALNRDPQAMEGMLRTMRRITRYRSGQIPQYLLTHPNPEARLQYVQSLLDYERDINPDRSFPPTDNFNFLRIKYRIMTSVKDPQRVRAYLVNSLSTSKRPEDSAMATYGLALLEARELNYVKGLENLAEVKRYFPNRNLLDIDSGIMYLDSGDVDKGYDVLARAFKKDPDDMYAAFHLARAYEKKGRLGDAELLYGRIMKNMPEYSQVYFELGKIKAGMKKTGESNFYLGKYYLYEGKLKLAREYLAKAKKDPTVPQTLQQESDKLVTLLDDIEE